MNEYEQTICEIMGCDSKFRTSGYFGLWLQSSASGANEIIFIASAFGFLKNVAFCKFPGFVLSSLW
jgi:hypothetical protein